jgi:hypothetical protein
MRLGVPGAKSEITYLVITNCPTRYILWFGLRKLGTGLGMVRRRHGPDWRKNRVTGRQRRQKRQAGHRASAGDGARPAPAPA